MKKIIYAVVILSIIGIAYSFKTNKKEMEKSKIIYVFDPMCGWCFGFGKVMGDFYDSYKDSFNFDVVSGGMVVGEREGPIGDFADYILGAYKRVEEYSGMKYGQPYLDQLKTKTLWSSSVKPSIALETFKTFNTKDVVHFSHAIQKAYFIDGKDLRNEDVYKQLIKPYGINEAEFIKKLNSDELKTQTTNGFQMASNWGITGYPAVLIEHKGKYYAVARGFTDLESLKKNVNYVLSQ